MTVLVGHPPRRADRAAISLGAMLARSLNTDLVVVSVLPAPWPTAVAGHGDRDHAEWVRTEGAAAVAEARTVLKEVADDLPSRAFSVVGRSVPTALLEQARAVGARVLAVGSSPDGPWDRVVLGSSASRLLHSSHVPVAVAPRGFATHAVPRFDRVTCAFQGDGRSPEVLRRTAEVAVAGGALLRVVTFAVRGRTMFPPEVRGEEEVLDAFVEQARAAQEAAVSALASGSEGRPDGGLAGSVECLVPVGRDWAQSVGSLDWHHGDVLVLGSSPGGVLSRVFLGSHATRILRHAPVPVVVFPA